MKKPLVVILSTACWALASSAMAFDHPLSPRPGAQGAAPTLSGPSLPVSTGLIEQIPPSELGGRSTLISVQNVDTTSPPGTNPFAGRNYDGILIPAGTCANATTCSGGETLCAGTCVNLATDPSNCGSCGSVCALPNTCQSGTCAAPPASCTLDSQCGTGAYCDTGTGTCLAQGGMGVLCAGNNQCESGLTCQLFTSGTCTSPADCGGGVGACTAGMCVYQVCFPVACTSDADCGTGFSCDTGTAGCVSQQAAGTMCTGADQCLSGTCAGTAQFAERFVGQSLGFSGDFDVLSGTPVTPLALQVGMPDHNLDALMDEFGTVNLNGLGPVGYLPALPVMNPDYDGIGEGSIAALFLSDYGQVGFDVLGVDGGGMMIVDFFRRDGSLIDTAVASTGPPLTSAITITVAFQRVGGVNDIAGFSIYNTDPGGLGYANFRLAIPFSPVPALSTPTLGLLIAVLGLVGMLGLWRARATG